jgi:serine phosphatase RsbU (regulator of sigma subunit)
MNMSQSFPFSSETALAIQNRLLPAVLPRVRGIECHAECRRCGRLGGDFFDFVTPNPDEVITAIGNVPVDGVAGAILISALQASLRSLGSRDAALSDLAEELNRNLWDIAPDDTVTTLFSARIASTGRHLGYINAGHLTALVLRANGHADRLPPNGPGLGLSRSSRYLERVIRFEPGDTLVALSEGIKEDEVLAELRRGDPLSRIAEAAAWRGQSSVTDATIVLVRHNGTAELRPEARSPFIVRAAAA